MLNGESVLMLPKIHMAWVVVLLAGVFYTAAEALEAGEAAVDQAVEQNDVTDSERSSSSSSAIVDWSHGLRLHRIVESWVASGVVQSDVGRDAIIASDVAAVKVTLRSSGWAVGAGEAATPVTKQQDRPPGPFHEPVDPPASDLSQPVDLTGLAAEATRRAIDEALGTLRHAHDRAVEDGRRAADDPPVSVSEFATELQVDLQIARTPKPLGAGAAQFSKTVLRRLQPGLDGLQLTDMTQGVDRCAWSWPADALAANLSLTSQLTQLFSRLGGRSVVSIDAPGDPRYKLASFEVIHLVRPVGGEAATRLVRGNRVLAPVSLSSRAVYETADRLAGHLINRVLKDGRVAGDYLPSADRYDPPLAPIEEAALAAYALGRRAAWLSRAAPASQAGQAASQASAAVVKHLAKRLDSGEKNTASAAAAARAFMLMTITQSPGWADQKALRDGLMNTLLALLDRAPAGLAATDDPPGDPNTKDQPIKAADQTVDSTGPSMPRAVRSLIAAALAGAYEQSRQAHLRVVVEQTLQDLINGAQPSDWVEMAPWLGWAQFTMLRVGLGPQDRDRPSVWPVADQARRGERVQQVVRAIEYCQARQVSAPVGGGAADIVGGYDLTPGQGADPSLLHRPAPDWHTGRVLAFLAAAAREPLLTDPDRQDPIDQAELLLGCGLAARFMTQLMFDETNAYYVRSRSDALGAVRQSLWDNRLTIAASAMALLGVTELQDTLDHLAPVQSPQP